MKKHALYYLDSNAWINLWRNSSAYENLVKSYVSGKLEVLVLPQNVDELLDDARVSPNNIETNKKLLSPFMKKVDEDQVFLLGVSHLNSALLTSEPGSRVYAEHARAKGPSLQGVRDGIHLLNASGTGAILVSCDKQVHGTAKRHHVLCLCLAEFAKIANLGGALKCNSCGT